MIAAVFFFILSFLVPVVLLEHGLVLLYQSTLRQIYGHPDHKRLEFARGRSMLGIRVSDCR